MSTTFALFRRELAVYFVSPMAYIILTGLMFIFGSIFWDGTRNATRMNAPFAYSEVLAAISGLMVFIAPLITMRLLAEERNRGTFETLMTAPVTELQVVLGKYAATIAFLIFLLLPTIAHAILIGKYGTFDASESVAGYIGLFMTTASLLAIGVFVSSICSSQVTAGVVTFAIIFILLLSANYAQHIDGSTKLGAAAKSVIELLNPYRNMGDFTRGILDTRPIVYFLSLIVFFLFLSVRVLELRRWK
ncbi:MAG TPA: ABC transporter permease subunit [Planctomycetota bacterium]|nr:ABC transporter permease subunit [Planctomycetota bacterium]